MPTRAIQASLFRRSAVKGIRAKLASMRECTATQRKKCGPSVVLDFPSTHKHQHQRDKRRGAAVQERCALPTETAYPRTVPQLVVTLRAPEQSHRKPLAVGMYHEKSWTIFCHNITFPNHAESSNGTCPGNSVFRGQGRAFLTVVHKI